MLSGGNNITVRVMYMLRNTNDLGNTLYVKVRYIYSARLHDTLPREFIGELTCR